MTVRTPTARLLLGSLFAVMALMDNSVQAETTIKANPVPAVKATVNPQAVPAGQTGGITAPVKAPVATSGAPTSLNNSGTRELRVKNPPPPPPPIIPVDQINKLKGMQ